METPAPASWSEINCVSILQLRARLTQAKKCISSWFSKFHLTVSIIYSDAKNTSFLGHLLLIDEVAMRADPAALGWAVSSFWSTIYEVGF